MFREKDLSVCWWVYVGHLDLVTSDDFVGEGKLVLGEYIDEEKSGQESKELSVSLKNDESPKAGNYAGKVKLKVTLLVVPSAKPERPSKMSLQVIMHCTIQSVALLREIFKCCHDHTRII